MLWQTGLKKTEARKQAQNLSCFGIRLWLVLDTTSVHTADRRDPLAAVRASSYENNIGL